jgi:hypothetical protein
MLREDIGQRRKTGQKKDKAGKLCSMINGKEMVTA